MKRLHDTHLVDRLQIRAESSMDTKYTAVNDRTESQIIKYFATVAPDVCWTILALTLVIETVDLSDLSGLVITTDEGDAVWIADFVRKQEEECLDRVEPSIDKVTCVVLQCESDAKSHI